MKTNFTGPSTASLAQSAGFDKEIKTNKVKYLAFFGGSANSKYTRDKHRE